MRLTRSKTRRGASAIEFALTLPVMMLLSFGIVDWCWYFVNYQAVLSSAQRGARTASQTAMVDDPAAAGRVAAQENLTASYPAGTPPGAVYSGVILGGNSVQVTVTVNFVPLAGMAGTPAKITAVARMRVEDAA